MTLKATPLNNAHRAAGARMVDFGGWDMPVNYGSQIEEHNAVRTDVGMFDVAHMCVVDIKGDKVRAFLRGLLANNVDKLQVSGKALYSCMLNPEGRVIDDLIVYFMAEDHFRIVVNAGTTDKDLTWFRQHAPAYGVGVKHRSDLGILAVQGPQARDQVYALLPAGLAERAKTLTPFSAAWDGELFVGRTGYTGEDGFELILPHDILLKTWDALATAGVRPCGLGARDTLRLEAGMNLYGQDMDDGVSPLECGLAWTVAFAPEDRDFIGRKVLEAQKAALPRKSVGLVLEGRGVLRAHMPVRAANGAAGETTSGGFAPTMKGSIAMARVAGNAVGPYEVEIRGQWLPAREVKPPFVRNGKVLV